MSDAEKTKRYRTRTENTEIDDLMDSLALLSTLDTSSDILVKDNSDGEVFSVRVGVAINIAMAELLSRSLTLLMAADEAEIADILESAPDSILEATQKIVPDFIVLHPEYADEFGERMKLIELELLRRASSASANTKMEA